MAILDSKSFSRKLKEIYAAALDNGRSINYSDLKGFFAGCDLTQEQAEMVWNYLDSKCVFVQHIDENDPLFSRIPEKERDEKGNVITEESKYDSVYQSALSTAQPAPDKPAVNGRQDVSNVQTDSLLIAGELIRRNLGPDAVDDTAAMACARKLAAKLRPNEMHALVMFWKLEAGTPSYTIGQIGSVTGIDPATMEEIEAKAASCAPKNGKSKSRSFFNLFRKS